MHEIRDPDLAIAWCRFCKKETVAVNLDMCLDCDTFTDACCECLEQHNTDKHQATARERLNEELKQQIRAQAETLCSLIDQQEQLLKLKESQLTQLAQELDRLTVVH